ncbi:class I SAM-dependent methyltransferase [Alphaproteobacteria bacterium]|nr:class I SAM-dependent methyltransferase [Alphaproteobacteria bacterium]
MLNALFHSISQSIIERSLNKAYAERLDERGSTPQGVFWNSRQNQIVRFAALLSRVTGHVAWTKPTPKSLSIADIGCGYGAMLDFIHAQPQFSHLAYTGLDINPAMIAACQDNFPNEAHLFSVGKKPVAIVDFSVFSGTFNLCHIDDTKRWEAYIFSCLDACWQNSRIGMALNLLCAPEAKISNQIFYANRLDFIAKANARFGSTQAIATREVKGDYTFLITRKK